SQLRIEAGVDGEVRARVLLEQVRAESEYAVAGAGHVRLPDDCPSPSRQREDAIRLKLPVGERVRRCVFAEGESLDHHAVGRQVIRPIAGRDPRADVRDEVVAPTEWLALEPPEPAMDLRGPSGLEPR